MMLYSSAWSPFGKRRRRWFQVVCSRYRGFNSSRVGSRVRRWPVANPTMKYTRPLIISTHEKKRCQRWLAARSRELGGVRKPEMKPVVIHRCEPILSHPADVPSVRVSAPTSKTAPLVSYPVSPRYSAGKALNICSPLTSNKDIASAIIQCVSRATRLWRTTTLGSAPPGAIADRCDPEFACAASQSLRTGSLCIEFECIEPMYRASLCGRNGYFESRSDRHARLLRHFGTNTVVCHEVADRTESRSCRSLRRSRYGIPHIRPQAVPRRSCCTAMGDARR